MPSQLPPIPHSSILNSLLTLAHSVSHWLAAPSVPWVSLLALLEVTADLRGTGLFQVWNLALQMCAPPVALASANGRAPFSRL